MPWNQNCFQANKEIVLLFIGKKKKPLRNNWIEEAAISCLFSLVMWKMQQNGNQVAACWNVISHSRLCYATWFHVSTAIEKCTSASQLQQLPLASLQELSWIHSVLYDNTQLAPWFLFLSPLIYPKGTLYLDWSHCCCSTVPLDFCRRVCSSASM